MKNKNDVIEQYKEIARNYVSFDECYNKLKESNDITICKYCLDDDGLWKRLELKWILEHFEKTEEYEKCIFIKDLMKDNYIAGDNKQDELNEKLKQYYI